MSALPSLVAFIVACFIAASTGILFPPGRWYDGLAKPTWQPPKWLFAPVWTALYVMIAIAGWRVWSVAGFDGARWALALYALQLVLNAAWTPIFFGLHRMGIAFAEIVLLWLAIAATMVLFFQHDPLAAYLLIPYLAWVSFASALNFTVWRLNAGPEKAAGSARRG
jgi:translocator protein